MDPERLIVTLGEPNRLRIVLLLAEGPRTVGDVAKLLGALQPQTSKHIQALELAGAVIVHRLGRRRVIALRREAMSFLGDWFSTLAVGVADESVLVQYERAIQKQEAGPAASGAAAPRSFLLSVNVPAQRSEVWPAWATPERLSEWWAPPHFSVVECTVDPVPGGDLRIVLAEGDGARHTATGSILDVEPAHLLRFSLAPLDPAGAPLFAAVHTVTFTDGPGRSTEVAMAIDVSDVTADAASAVAGIPFGWRQTLDQLASLWRD